MWLQAKIPTLHTDIRPTSLGKLISKLTSRLINRPVHWAIPLSTNFISAQN